MYNLFIYMLSLGGCNMKLKPKFIKSLDITVWQVIFNSGSVLTFESYGEAAYYYYNFKG